MKLRNALSLAIAVSMLAPSALVLSLQSSAAAATECADGIDNDLDGRTDYPSDSDCDSLIDTLERPTSVDFDVQWSDGKDFAQRGEILQYTLRIENKLGEPAVAAVRVSLANVTYLVDPPADAEQVDSRTLRWNTMNFAAHEVKTIIVKARVVEHTPDGSAVVSRATVANASAADQTMVSTAGLPPADITVSITDGADQVAAGSEHVYTVRVTNRSSYTALGINVAASLPIYSQFLSTNEGGFWDGRNVRWNKLAIDAKSSRELKFSVLVDANAVGKTLMAGAAASDKRDSDTTAVVAAGAAKSSSSAKASSSSSSAMTSGPVNVVFRLTPDRNETVAGGTADFRIDLRNTSDENLSDLTIRMSYDPAKIAVVDGPTPDRGSMTWLEWDVPALPKDRSWQGVVTLRAKDGAVGPDAMVVHAAIVGAGSTQIASASRDAEARVSTLGELPTTGFGLDAMMMIAAALACAGLVAAQRKLTA